jgi:nitrate reductase beta subunit
MPSIGDYYEPWTYDYENLTTAPLQEHSPVARPKSLISGKDMKVSWSANWDDDLGGGPKLTAADPVLRKISDDMRLEFERTFMFYLPRICEHCLNPSCAASCPSGAIYKRTEDGIVLVDPPGRGGHPDRLRRDLRREAGHGAAAVHRRLPDGRI